MERRVKRKWVGLLLFVSLSSAFTQIPAQLSSVPAARLAHIRRGINLSEWFAQVYDPRGYTKEHFQTWTTASDIALIKSMGFDHVRLSVNPQPIMDANRRGGTAEYFGSLDAAIKMILDAGLAVELDMHPDSDFKARLKEDDFVERFADFWRTVARHYSSWDQDRVFFEILNEPEMRDPYRWYGVEAKLATAIRQGAPAAHDHRRRRELGQRRRHGFPRAASRSQRHLRFSFLRAAHLHSSGRNLGSVLLALAQGTALSIVSGKCRASCGRSPRSSRPSAGDSLWSKITGMHPASKPRSIRLPIGRSSAMSADLQ